MPQCQLPSDVCITLCMFLHGLLAFAHAVYQALSSPCFSFLRNVIVALKLSQLGLSLYYICSDLMALTVLR